MSPKILKNAQVANSDEDAQVELRRRIEQRAHELWVERGRPEGMALSHWLQAETEISAETHPIPGQKSPRTRDQWAARLQKSKPSPADARIYKTSAS